MDKAKTKSVIVIAVLAVLFIALAGYAAGLNSQLSAEKTKTMQLDDQIAGLNAKVNELQSQLTTATARAGDQANLASNLQNSLNAVNTELANLKTAYAGLESKLKEQVPAVTVQ